MRHSCSRRLDHRESLGALVRIASIRINETREIVALEHDGRSSGQRWGDSASETCDSGCLRAVNELLHMMQWALMDKLRVNHCLRRHTVAATVPATLGNNDNVSFSIVVVVVVVVKISIFTSATSTTISLKRIAHALPLSSQQWSLFTFVIWVTILFHSFSQPPVPECASALLYHVSLSILYVSVLPPAMKSFPST